MLIYVNGYSTTGSSYTGIGFMDPGVGIYSGNAQIFIGDLDINVFDLRDTTRSTVRVFGNDSNDTLYAAPLTTRQFYSGGAGVDTIIYSEASNQYTGTISNSITLGTSGRVIDYATIRHASKTNPDTLTNVERLKFSDTNIALDIGKDQAAGSAYMLYRAALDREPDYEGLGFWISALDRNVNINDVAQAFMTNPEYIAKYGADNSTTEFVTNLYANVLHRPLDAPGFDFWVKNLDSGLTTRASILQAFASSPDNVNQVVSLIADGIQYTEYVG